MTGLAKKKGAPAARDFCGGRSRYLAIVDGGPQFVGRGFSEDSQISLD